jgi:hypothetical protein
MQNLSVVRKLAARPSLQSSADLVAGFGVHQPK